MCTTCFFTRVSHVFHMCFTCVSHTYFCNQATEVITRQRLCWFACCRTYIHQSITAMLQFLLCWTYRLRSTPWITISSSKDSEHPLESTVEHWTGWSHSFVVELSLSKSAACTPSFASSAPGCRKISAGTTFICALYSGCT